MPARAAAVAVIDEADSSNLEKRKRWVEKFAADVGAVGLYKQPNMTMPPYEVYTGGSVEGIYKAAKGALRHTAEPT